jgi:hypothetical protein
MTHLKQQIADYRTSIKEQHQRITDLEHELELSPDLIANRSNSLLADIIFGDLCQNRNVNPQGRRYSLEMLSWVGEIHGLSPVASATIRAVLSLPFETLLQMEFFDCKVRVRQSLTNLSFVDDLLTIRRLSNRVTLDPKHQIDAILAVDAVVMRPVITIYENGEIERIEDLNNLTSPDLFPQFVETGCFYQKGKVPNHSPQ